MILQYYNMETNISSNQSQLQQAATGQEVEPKGIVLNRMYTGSYLSTNLGHEVINMFQADNGKHYLYLNAKGNFAVEHKGQISEMLLVRYDGENKVEVLAWANGLTEVPGADNTYKKFKQDSAIFNMQKKYIEEANITYGNQGLIEIFGTSEQQNVYITYQAENFYRPQKRIYIQYEVDEYKLQYEDSKSTIEYGEKDITIFLTGYQFGKATLKQYIYPNVHKNSIYKFDTRKTVVSTHSIFSIENRVHNKRDSDWNTLKIILNPNNNSIWNKVDNEENKISEELINNHEPHTVSLFDIMPKLQHDENCFSDALKFFIKRDKDHWVMIFKTLCKDYNIGSIRSVEREEDATISKKVKEQKQTSQNNEDTNKQSEDGNNDTTNPIKQKRGGRIDLLIRTQNAYIVIENKIKSGINSKEDDAENENQLDRYRYYVNYCILGERINKLNDENQKLKKELLEKYNSLTYENFTNEEDNIVKYIKEKLEKTPDIKQYYFILAPDYNMPDKNDRKGYLPIAYSILTGITKDEKDKELTGMMLKYHVKNKDENLWSAFYDAMKRHSYESENDSLYEDMKNTFFTRIKELSQNR